MRRRRLQQGVSYAARSAALCLRGRLSHAVARSRCRQSRSFWRRQTAAQRGTGVVVARPRLRLRRTHVPQPLRAGQVQLPVWARPLRRVHRTVPESVRHALSSGRISVLYFKLHFCRPEASVYDNKKSLISEFRNFLCTTVIHFALVKFSFFCFMIMSGTGTPVRIQ